MKLTQRESQIIELLLEGCDNQEIADRLGIALRTVKAYFNRLFLRFGIRGGVKRVKLAVLFYKESLCSVEGKRASSSSSPKDSATKMSHSELGLPNTSLKTTSVQSTTNWDFGTERNSRCGM